MFLADPAATESLGRRMGDGAYDGLVLALTGDLGMGKSALARAVGRGLGVEGRIPSPTFVIVNSYEGRLPFHHVDLYRLDGLEELEQLGLDDLVGRGVVAVEWAERFPDVLPSDHLALTLTEEGEGRLITVTGGPRALAWWAEVTS